MSKPFHCCGHVQHLRRRVDDLTYCECVDCGHRWVEYPISEGA